MSDELYMRLDDAVKRVNLLCKWEFGKDYTFDEVLLRQELEQICQIPSPVEVVRCKDCKYWNRDTIRHSNNDFREWDEAECEALAELDPYNEIDRTTEDEHFCSYAERIRKPETTRAVLFKTRFIWDPETGDAESGWHEWHEGFYSRGTNRWKDTNIQKWFEDKDVVAWQEKAEKGEHGDD